jgi:hypothetical protein
MTLRAKREEVKDKKRKQYLTVQDLKRRWRVSQQFIERKVREPGFPTYMQLPGSRIRLFDEEVIEQYERAAVKQSTKKEVFRFER